jgi:PAS domain S-box-containing protein
VSKTARDVGESWRTQKALNQEIEERRRIFETSRDLILVTDTAGNFALVSPSSLAILGYRPDEMIGHSAVEFIDPDDLDSTREEMRSARQGRPTRNFETRCVHRDGQAVTLTWMGTWSEPVRRHFFVGRDLTEKRAAEAQLRQAAANWLTRRCSGALRSRRCSRQDIPRMPSFITGVSTPACCCLPNRTASRIWRE